MPEFGPHSTIRQVLEEHPDGRRLLWEHGYDIGEGFIDLASQHQSLLTAARAGRVRDLEGLLGKLNRAPAAA